MKNFIAVLLVFSMIFVFAACKNTIVDEQTTEPVAEETGRPGDWVTNADGEPQTTANHYVILDDNSKPMTEIVTDENGSEKVQVVTTVVYDIETYPGATQAPTVAPGNTMADKKMDWPKYDFMAKLPVLAEKISDAGYSKTQEGEAAVIYLNDMSYADYLKYIDKCKSAGFEQTYGSKLPEKEADGEDYIYYSIANGLYVGVIYYTHSAPYRNCDVKITVANYDAAGINAAMNSES